MASTHCILHLCRLCVRPRLMHLCLCKWPLRGRILKAMRIPYTEEYQNNTVSQISGKILRMHKQLKPGVLSAHLWTPGTRLAMAFSRICNSVCNYGALLTICRARRNCNLILTSQDVCYHHLWWDLALLCHLYIYIPVLIVVTVWVDHVVSVIVVCNIQGTLPVTALWFAPFCPIRTKLVAQNRYSLRLTEFKGVKVFL